MTPTRDSAACEWCGRAVKQDAEGRWYAVKGAERGYEPLTCEAAEDVRHSPDQPEALPAVTAATAVSDTMIVGDLQTGEVYEEPLPPPMTPEEFVKATTGRSR